MVWQTSQNLEMFLWATVISTILIADSILVHGGPLSFIVDQGCLYLAHYVKDNYIILEPTTLLTPGDDVNWAMWTDDEAAARYLPAELTQGLLECGKQFAFFALGAPDWLFRQNNLNFTANLVG